MHLEGVQELNQDFILSLSSQFNIWVVLRIINVLKIIELHNSVAVFVQLLEGSLHQLLPLSVHLTDNYSEELIVADSTIVINIKEAKKDLGLILSQLDSVILDSLEEFRKLEQSVVVIVDDLEDSSQANDATGTSLSHLLSELLEDFLIRADVAGPAAVLLNIHLLSRRCSSDLL